MWIWISDTDLFSRLIWVLITVFKIHQMILETIEEGLFENMEMMAILGTFQALVSMLITFGADHFLDFL